MFSVSHVGVAVLASTLSSAASAADPAGTAPNELVIEQSHAPSGLTVRPLTAPLGAELSWTRAMLFSGTYEREALTLRPWGELSVLAELDDPQGPWNDVDVMGPSLATALGSVLTDGLALVEIKRGRFRQRHFARAYFRRTGLSVAWRIEF